MYRYTYNWFQQNHVYARELPHIDGVYWYEYFPVEIDPLGGFLAVSEDGKLSLNHWYSFLVHAAEFRLILRYAKKMSNSASSNWLPPFCKRFLSLISSRCTAIICKAIFGFIKTFYGWDMNFLWFRYWENNHFILYFW